MNNHAGRDELKVDAVSLPLDRHGRRVQEFVVIYNINIPMDIILDEDETINVLERVRDLLVRDFPDTLVGYQITASYNLIHTVTGARRVWTGSFSVRYNSPAQVSGFEEFNSETFVETSIDAIGDVEHRLNRPEAVASNWKVENIISIIFNCQSKVDEYSLIIRAFHRDGRRSHRTFPLP
jgi:hypothetical protein